VIGKEQLEGLQEELYELGRNLFCIIDALFIQNFGVGFEHLQNILQLGCLGGHHFELGKKMQEMFFVSDAERHQMGPYHFLPEFILC